MRILALISLLPLSVSGGELGVIVGTVSQHLGPAGAPTPLSSEVDEALTADYQISWNELNRTLGVEYIFDNTFALTAVSYHDSYYRDSSYAGFGWLVPVYRNGDATLRVGGFILYFHHEGYTIDLAPPSGYSSLTYVMPSRSYVAPLPGIAFSYKNVGANLAIIPPIEDGVPWTAALQFKVSL